MIALSMKSTNYVQNSQLNEESFGREKKKITDAMWPNGKLWIDVAQKN